MVAISIPSERVENDCYPFLIIRQAITIRVHNRRVSSQIILLRISDAFTVVIVTAAVTQCPEVLHLPRVREAIRIAVWGIALRCRLRCDQREYRGQDWQEDARGHQTELYCFHSISEVHGRSG